MKITFQEAKNKIAQKYCGTHAKWDTIDWYALNYSYKDEPLCNTNFGMEEMMLEEAAVLMAESWSKEANAKLY